MTRRVMSARPYIMKPAGVGGKAVRNVQKMFNKVRSFIRPLLAHIEHFLSLTPADVSHNHVLT